MVAKASNFASLIRIFLFLFYKKIVFRVEKRQKMRIFGGMGTEGAKELGGGLAEDSKQRHQNAEIEGRKISNSTNCSMILGLLNQK